MNAIVVAFGPNAATQQAVRRIRRIPAVRSIWAVPAADRRLAAVRHVTGAEHVERSGTVGIRSVIEQLGDAPTLLIHDDVMVSPRGLSTMLRILDEGADVVAPHSNEVGTPQFVGALPRSDEAASTLDRLADLGPSRRIDAARYSCIMAKASTMASFGGTLVVPGASLVRSHARIMLAPAAVAHDLSCHAGLVADVGPDPLLVASMIVRDEEAQLDGALESVRGLVDRVEICDTGSSDATVDIARAAGANVRQIDWRNDFGWARNQALESCRDADFFLHIDADERVTVDDAPLFRRWLKTWRAELHGVMIELRNHREVGHSASTHRAMRIARAGDAFWVGALHEAIRFEDQSDLSVVFYNGLHIDHYGYTKDVVDAKSKAARNIEISRSSYEADPSIKTMIDYARSLRMADEGDDRSEALFRDALAQVEPGTLPTVRSYLLAVVGASELSKGNVEQAVDLALQAVEILPKEDVALVTLGHAYTQASRWADLVELWEDVTSRPSAAPTFAVEANIVRFETLVGRALAECGRLDEAVAVLANAFATDAAAAAAVVGPCVAPLMALGASPEQLVPLVAADPTGSMIENIASVAPPPVTAAVGLAALELGGTSPTLFTTAMAASLVRSADGMPEEIAVHRERAASEHLDGLADMARRRGRPDIADILVPPQQNRGWDLTLVGGSDS